MSMLRVVAVSCAVVLVACGGDNDGAGGAGIGGAGGSAGSAGSPSGDPLELITDKGLVRGKTSGTVRSFLGIPYATPPVGDLRFTAPTPPDAWTETRDATTAGSMCAQQSPSTRSFAGSEDCLFVNVYTPDPPPAAGLPVMVWIHGGAFVFGNSADTAYAGDAVVERGDVVVVSLNYRLGAFGFLAHPSLSDASETNASGNYGLMDQRLALQWVKNNIANFGGDPDNVTIWGESAGGRSVCWHMLSPPSHGLFHRAIVESGFCTKPTFTLADAEAQGERLSDALGCAAEADALTCLRGKTPQEVVAAIQPGTSADLGGVFYQTLNAGFGFEPSIDGVNVLDQASTLFADGDIADVEVLHGANTDEGVLFHASVLGSVMPVNDETEYVAALERRFGDTDAAKVAEHYAVADFDSANDALAAVSGDAFFLCPARAMARALEARGRHNYLYNFGALLTGNPFPVLSSAAFHSGELPYVWGNPYALGSVPTEGEATAHAMQDAFQQFARSGDPNVTEASPTWPRYATDDDTLLSFGATEVNVVSMHKQDDCDFWDTITLPNRP